MNTKNFSLILDFDSTIVQAEALDVLPELCFPAGPERNQVLIKVAETTSAGMEGRISITESLQNRLSLLHFKREHLIQLVALLKERISPSMLSHREFFQMHQNSIFVITSGFEEYVVPVCSTLGIKPSHIFGNRLIFDETDMARGFDSTRLPAQAGGKTAQLRKLNPRAPVIVVGDGSTDLEMKDSGLVHTFVAYTETIRRAVVAKAADRVANDFGAVIELIEALH